MEKILACFACIKLSLCSVCICWLDFPPILFSVACCIDFFKDLLLSLIFKKRMFLLHYLLFPSTSQSHFEWTYLYLFNNKFTFFNVFLKTLLFVVLKSHFSSPSCLFKTDSFHCSASLCPQIPIQTILALPGCDMHGLQLFRFS